ncbi:MAG: ribonuclease HII [Rhodospirillales bacterium]|nr:ribonuclease HII [Rhodospirillales bacterium]
MEDVARTEGHKRIAGVDEAGRGPWAGPVFAAAVIFDPARLPDELLAGLDDSKKLTARRRTALYETMSDLGRSGGGVEIGVGHAEVAEIDEINILQASLLAMRRAIERLDKLPDYALIDGRIKPRLACRANAVVKGDQLSLSIAAASIIAKVTRDRLMGTLATLHPGYGWETNMGYGTAKHQTGLEKLGVTQHHRESFAPIHKILSARGG